jgi:hypothetical protein
VDVKGRVQRRGMMTTNHRNLYRKGRQGRKGNKDRKPGLPLISLMNAR